MGLAENIKNFRKQAKLTQVQLAKMVGINTNTLQRYEYGEREPNFTTIGKIAAALDIDTPTLMGMGPYNGKNIKKIRDSLKYNESDFAKKINISVEDLNKYESGIFEPTVDLLYTISDVFDLDTFWQAILLERQQYSTPERHRLTVAFDKLNEPGQAKAVDYVEDLTKVPDYQRAPSDPGTGPDDGTQPD